ncbi:MAG: hypothetical protein LBM38_06245 [Clostridiales bacterium]|nr:hypothetical protein [Clostridiales bacterium]
MKKGLTKVQKAQTETMEYVQKMLAAYYSRRSKEKVTDPIISNALKSKAGVFSDYGKLEGIVENTEEIYSIYALGNLTGEDTSELIKNVANNFRGGDKV